MKISIVGFVACVLCCGVVSATMTIESSGMLWDASYPFEDDPQPFTSIAEIDLDGLTGTGTLDVEKNPDRSFGFGHSFIANDMDAYISSCGVDCEQLWLIQYGENRNDIAYHYFTGDGFSDGDPVIRSGWLALYEGESRWYAPITARNIDGPSAVPEPGSLLLLMSSLAMFAMRR